jgi:hypothetical protein
VSKQTGVLIAQSTTLYDYHTALIAQRTIERLSITYSLTSRIMPNCRNPLLLLDLRINPILFGPLARLLQYSLFVLNTHQRNEVTMQNTYTDDWTTALGIDIATLERARRVAVQAAEAIWNTDSVDLSRSLLIVGYCDDLNEVLVDTLRLADYDLRGNCQRLFSMI